MSPTVQEAAATLQQLCQAHGVEHLELFGSAAAGATHRDVDFLVRFLPSTPEVHAQRYFGLLAALEDLFGTPVDLVEERAVVNPYFLESIAPSRRVLYAA